MSKVESFYGGSETLRKESGAVRIGRGNCVSNHLLHERPVHLCGMCCVSIDYKTAECTRTDTCHRQVVSFDSYH